MSVLPDSEPPRAGAVLTSFVCSSLAQEGTAVRTALSSPQTRALWPYPLGLPPSLKGEASVP